MSRNAVPMWQDTRSSAMKEANAGDWSAGVKARVDAAYAECAAIARAEGNEDIARRIEEAMRE